MVGSSCNSSGPRPVQSSVPCDTGPFARSSSRILPFVEKPGRYIGLERNVTRKDLSRASVTLALAFPDTYEIGMSHTGLKILYELVNRREDFACERVYAPWVDLEAKMRERGHPALLDGVLRARRRTSTCSASRSRRS